MKLNLRNISPHSMKWLTVKNLSLKLTVILCFVICFSAFAAGETITGKVIDKDGPLAGVSVLIKGTNRGTVTDIQGNYKLLVEATDKALIFSFTGLKKQEIEIKGRKVINVTFDEEVSSLDEVQVIGYGKTSRRMSTGGVSAIKAVDIANQPVNNIMDALAGKITGLQIAPTTGVSGAAQQYRIRGKSSFETYTTANPLFLINGLPVNANQNINYGQVLSGGDGLNMLFGLNPADIESVTVLKDAESTAIYGSQGANGVVLITTKQGSSDAGIKINLNMSGGFKKVGHFMDMLDIHQYLAMRREALKNDNIIPTAINAPDLMLWDTTAVHDWQRELIGGTAPTEDVNLTISGGSRNTTFYISGAYHNEGSVMQGAENSKTERKSFMATINHISDNKKFKMNVQSSYSTTDLNMSYTDFTSYINLAPNYPMYDASGEPNWSAPAGYPLANLLQRFSAPTINFSGNIKVQYEIIKGLNLKANAGFNYTTLNQSYSQPEKSQNPLSSPAPVATLNAQTSTNDNWLFEPQAEYIRSIENHHFVFLVGASFQYKMRTNITYTGTGFANDAFINNIGSASTVQVQSSKSPNTFASLFGRISYDYNQELLLNATFRRDGSSKFGPDQKYGNFGAVGLGWIFTKEEFVTSTLPFLSFGKIRASVGTSGNDQIPEYSYVATYQSYPGTGTSAYDGLATLQPKSISNDSLNWEINTKSEVALELGLFKDRIWLSGTYFRNRTGNQLIWYSISGQAGFTFYMRNFPAEVQNDGWEFELTSQNIKSKDFNWNTSFNFSLSHTKLISFPGLATSGYRYSYKIGESINRFQPYVLAGLDAKGKPLYVDLNGVGGQTLTAEDRVTDGNRDPLYGGMTNQLSYKGFNLSFTIQYTKTRETSNIIPNGVVGVLNRNFSPYVLGRWQKPGDEAYTIIPAFSTKIDAYDIMNYGNTVQNITDTHIFRLNNASLSYTVPEKFVNQFKIDHLQLYLNGQNLFVLDKYAKYRLDPASGSTNLPPLRTIVLGLNITF